MVNSPIAAEGKKQDKHEDSSFHALLHLEIRNKVFALPLVKLKKKKNCRASCSI